MEDITLERRGYFYSFFSKEAVDPTGIHDEIKKRRLETLGQLQAMRSGQWQMSHPCQEPTQVRARFDEKASMEKSGNEICLLNLHPRNNPLYSVGHILDCCF